MCEEIRECELCGEEIESGEESSCQECGKEVCWQCIGEDMLTCNDCLDEMEQEEE